MVKQPEPRSGHIETNGVRLHYLDWGGTGEPIVILHATGVLGRIYRPIAQALTAIGRVFSYDQRGHGDSGAADDGKYDWYATVADLEGFIAAMKLGRVRGFGHSSGATAIGSLAFERPELISRAVLVEPVVFETPEGPEAGWRNPFIDRTLKRRRVFDSVEAAFKNFEHKLPYATWRKDLLHDYCEFGTRPSADGKRELKCRPEIEARFYQTSHEFDGLARIFKCRAPLLVILGGRGDSVGAAMADRIASGLKNGRVVSVADGGHFVPMEKPEEIAQMTVQFLGER